MKIYVRIASDFLVSVIRLSTLTEVFSTSLPWSDSCKHNLSNKPLLTAGNYLVIGVFGYEKNAQAWKAQAIYHGLYAEYAFHPLTHYFYVYVAQDKAWRKLLSRYYEVRNSTIYHDAWIFSVDSVSELPVRSKLPAEVTEAGKPSLLTSGSTNEHSYQTAEQEGKKIVFEAYSHANGVEIATSIALVDGQQAKFIEQIPAYTVWNLPQELRTLDTIQAIVQTIGYRKLQVDLCLQDLWFVQDNPYIIQEKDTTFVQLPLIELEKGDIQVMYNTYFYGNSSVMRDHSRYELESLYKMLHQNPQMRVRLHGHTNGNSRGVAYLFRQNQQNFFDIRRTKEYRKRNVSSAKLSAYRAETIKSYLISRGIREHRIETRGWGGKKMIYEPDSPMAKNNIRVEIEVLDK